MFSPPKRGRHKQQQGMQDTHLVSKMKQMLQDNCMLICIHLTQEEDWRLIKAVIATHTSSFLKQQEHKGMILFNKKMTVTSLLY